MNILFLPTNTASQPSITAAALNKLDGVNAICVTTNNSKYHQTDNVIYIKGTTTTKNPLKWAFVKLRYWNQIRKYILWADVLHYTWGAAIIGGLDLKLAKALDKVIFVEWLGSEIRNFKIYNKYNKHAELLTKGNDVVINESATASDKVQKMFFKYKAVPLIAPEPSLYLNKKLFKNSAVSLMQRMNVANFKPNFPLIGKEKPLIVHSPSNKAVKGTEYILNVVEKLRDIYDFDFKLLHNISRDEVLNELSKCDIFLDQILLGGYGIAALEAMSFGKPVICCIMPEVFKVGLPEECPIVNANIENIGEQLIRLITDSELRNTIGKKSREYVEVYHDVDVLALQLYGIYQDELKKRCPSKI